MADGPAGGHLEAVASESDSLAARRGVDIGAAPAVVEEESGDAATTEAASREGITGAGSEVVKTPKKRKAKEKAKANAKSKAKAKAEKAEDEEAENEEESLETIVKKPAMAKKHAAKVKKRPSGHVEAKPKEPQQKKVRSDTPAVCASDAGVAVVEATSGSAERVDDGKPNLRDYMKSRKFNSMWKTRSLPPEAMKLVDEAVAANTQGFTRHGLPYMRGRGLGWYVGLAWAGFRGLPTHWLGQCAPELRN